MTEAAPAPKTPRTRKTEEPEVVEAEVVEAQVVEEPAHASQTEPVIATVEPDAVKTEQPRQEYTERVVYVTAPAAPRKLGNRGIGSVLAVASGLVYALLLAVLFAIIGLQFGGLSFFFLAQPSFYVPVLFYVIGAVLLVLIANRAGWAAHVVGSLLVGVLVYFGTVGLVLLGQGVILMTPDEAAVAFRSGLGNPFVIASALLAREVSLWSGAIIARRGRTLKARNAEARSAWEREVAEKRAQAEARL